MFLLFIPSPVQGSQRLAAGYTWLMCVCVCMGETDRCGQEEQRRELFLARVLGVGPSLVLTQA